MSSDTGINSTNVPMTDESQEWKGMTLDQLKRARARALVRREVGRATMQYSLDNVKDNVSTNGIRGLMFSPDTATSRRPTMCFWDSGSRAGSCR